MISSEFRRVISQLFNKMKTALLASEDKNDLCLLSALFNSVRVSTWLAFLLQTEGKNL